MSARIPAVVLGGTGYVAGELLRLLASHPQMSLAAVVSESQAGSPVNQVFPNLHDAFGELCFISRAELVKQVPEDGPVAIFSAAPHGASAAMVSEVLGSLANKSVTVVDVSADFRFNNEEQYGEIYGQPHGAPDLLPSFSCGLPEHLSETEKPHIAHPGCFATAMLLATVPLMGMDDVEDFVSAVGVTGSTGSGRSPTVTTHHPFRHSNLFAYKPLVHRHAPEVIAVCESVCGRRPELAFIPHSGPIARGIHMTLTGRCRQITDTDTIRNRLADFYNEARFVTVVDGMPRIKDVAGSNYAHVGVAVEGNTVAIMVAIDNLIKGAAGGAIQWMNRKLGLPEESGLVLPGPAWI